MLGIRSLKSGIWNSESEIKDGCTAWLFPNPEPPIPSPGTEGVSWQAELTAPGRAERTYRQHTLLAPLVTLF